MTKLDEIEATGPDHGNDLTRLDNFEWLINRVKTLTEALQFYYAPESDFDLAMYEEKIVEDGGDVARLALDNE